MKFNIKNWFKGKNTELYVALFLAAVVCVALFATSPKVDNSTEDTTQFDEYIQQLENKISSVISRIDGCSNVKVALTCTSSETVYVFQTESVQSGQTITQTTTPVLVEGQPLVSKVLPPQICGVVIVCNGAEDAAIRVKIKQTVVTLLDISADKVQVFS